MKKQILLFTGLLLASAAQAQITLTSSSYPGASSIIGADSLQVTTAASTFPTLTAATNAMWDMSTVTDSTAVLFAYYVSPDTTEAEFADSDTYNFSTYSYQGNVQSAVTSSGLIQYGVNVDSATFSITGGTIYVPIQHSVFSAPYTVISFPAAMSSSWTSNYSSTFNYAITYSILTNEPGGVKSIITEMDTVVGWGEMRVKDIAGSPSAWFHVLQVQATTITVDSFSLGGSYTNPLLGTLLGDLGVTQGQTDTTYEQRYYRTGDVTPFARVEYPNSSFSSPSKGTTSARNLVSNGIKNVINTSGVNIYPNPVSNNRVSIDLPAISGSWSYELMDITGRTVANGALPTTGNHAQLSLPATATPGIYNIRLNNDGKQVCVRSIDIEK